jgi:uncharacterized protein
VAAQENLARARQPQSAAPVRQWLRLDDKHLTIELSVRPGAGKQGFLRIRPTEPVVALRSAPEKGRANRELVEFLAETLGVPTAAVSIIKGQGARQKVVRIETSSPQATAARLVELANP